MAPVKPMSAEERKGARRDSNPKTKPGVTGFEQDYNEEPGPRQDLNPDAVTDNSVLPEPLEGGESQRSGRGGTAKARAPKAAGGKRGLKSKA